MIFMAQMSNQNKLNQMRSHMLQICKNIINEFGSPVYVYDISQIIMRAKILNEAAYDFKVSYAMKANSNKQILKIIRANNIVNVDVVSPGQIYKALKSGYSPQQIMYTQNFISQSELKYALDNKITLNIGAFQTLKFFKEQLRNKKIYIRINPNYGAGENQKVTTGGPESKFGVQIQQIDELLKVCQQFDIKIIGLHQHIGSNLESKDEEIFYKAVYELFKVAKKFPNLQQLNIGGGFGIKYRQTDQEMKLSQVFEKIRKIRDNYNAQNGTNIKICIEPGRYLIAQAGYLICKLTAKKRTSKRVFYGTDTGFNHLIRPTLYGSYHQILNLSNPNAQQQVVNVCGNICECSDNLGVNIKLGGQIGDILVIKNAGAYGYIMSMNYNQRPRPAQVLINEDGNYRLIRKRQTFEDLEQKV